MTIGTPMGLMPATTGQEVVLPSGKLTCDDCSARVFRTSKTRRAFKCARCSATLCGSCSVPTESGSTWCETCHELLYKVHA